MDEYQRLLEQPPFEKLDLFLVILFSFVSGIISEIISYYLMYNKQEYRTKHSEAVQIYENITYLTYLNEIDDLLDSKKTKQLIKDLDDMELAFMTKLSEIKDLKHLNWVLSAFTFLIFMPILLGIFEATPVGKLPFKPFSIFLYFTKSNLPGSDVTDVSPAFIYTIVITLTKNNIKLYLGLGQPGGNTAEFALKGKFRERGIEF